MVELEKRMYVKSLPQCPAPGKGSVKSRCCQDGSGIQLSSQIHHKLRSCVTNDTKGGGNHGKNSGRPHSSVQFSHSVVSNSLQPHEPQHTRPPCPSPTPGVHPNPCPLSQWCHQAISSSVVPFSSCPQFLQASGSFPMSQLFASGGQSTGVSA